MSDPSYPHRIPYFKTNDVSQIIRVYHALAIPPNQTFLAALEQRALQLAPKFNIIQALTILSNFVKLEYTPSKELVRLLTLPSSQVMETMPYSDLARLINFGKALKRCGARPEQAFLEAYDHRVTELIETESEVTELNLPSIMTVCVGLFKPSPRLMEALLRNLPGNAERMNSSGLQGVAIALKWMHTERGRTPELYACLCQDAADKVCESFLV